MANTKRDDLISWLRDAHAMEAAHVDNLNRLIGFSDEYPQLKTQLQSHLELSKGQRDEIERELKRLGTDTSTLKDWGMKLAGWIEPLASRFTRDSMLKNCLAAHAYEGLEIASYRSILGRRRGTRHDGASHYVRTLHPRGTGDGEFPVRAPAGDYASVFAKPRIVCLRVRPGVRRSEWERSPDRTCYRI
jgi:ferritin-like metal-binding protein YciE